MRSVDLKGHGGTSLIEVVFALSILATALIGLGGLMYAIANHTRESAIDGYMAAAAVSGAAWGHGIPWDSLPARTGCLADSAGPLHYSRCMNLDVISPTQRRLVIVISPSPGPLAGLPDTVVVHRQHFRQPSPFKIH